MFLIFDTQMFIKTLCFGHQFGGTQSYGQDVSTFKEQTHGFNNLGRSGVNLINKNTHYITEVKNTHEFVGVSTSLWTIL